MYTVFLWFTEQQKGKKKQSCSYLAILLLPVYLTVSRTHSPLTALLKVYLTPYKELLAERVIVREAKKPSEEGRERGEIAVVWILISLAVFQGFRSA